VLPVAEELLTILREHRIRQIRTTADDLVFSEGGAPWVPSAFSKQFAEIVRGAGITGFRLHDARHAFASLALRGGTSVKEVSALLGHSSASLTLSTYAHVIEGLGRQTVESITKSLLAPSEVHLFR
jgi:integrase